MHRVLEDAKTMLPVLMAAGVMLKVVVRSISACTHIASAVLGSGLKSAKAAGLEECAVPA